MEDLLILFAVILVLAVPGSIIALLIWVASHGRRLRQSETRIAELQSQLANASSSGPAPDMARPASKTQTASEPWTKPDPAQATAPPAEPVRRGPPPPFVPPTKPEAKPSRPLHSAPSLVDRALTWLQVNWFYAVAAAALTLAGIFLVQYGAEQGLLPPRLRILAALIFGVVLIGGGEWIRRRFGDGEDVATAYLPSVLSGAGVVTLFGAILGARHLYDLIGQGAAMTGLSVVALAAIVLGWFHGPLLVAVGLVGGALAPFIVGGGRGSDLRPLHGYFLLLTVMGLAVDALRRWRGRWVSFLALGLGLGASTLLVLGAVETLLWHQVAVTAMALAALALPVSRFWPDHSAPMTLMAVGTAKSPRLETLIGFGAVAAVSVLAVVLNTAEPWGAIAMTIVLFAAVALWARRADGLQDAALAPAAALLAIIATRAAPEGAASITLALIAGGALSVASLVRSLQTDAAHRLGWTLAAVIIAPATGLALHLSWGGPTALGPYIWALHALAVAAGLTFAATLWAARDGDDRLRPSLAALIAVTLIGYALGQVLGEAALTASIALMAAGAVWLDRQFKLPLLSWFVVLSAPFTFWRLTAVPGIQWHVEGPLFPALVGMVAAVLGFGLAALWLRREDEVRTDLVAIAETATLAAFGFLVTVLLWRGLIATQVDRFHVGVGLTATIWLLLAWAQMVVRGQTGRMRWLRLGLAGVFGVLAFGALALGVTVGNPLVNDLAGNRVAGWPLINSMIPAYLVPGLALLLGWRDLRRRFPEARWPRGLGIAGLILTTGWAVLVIRHFWQGPGEMQFWKGVNQPEMTTYTVALLLLGAGLFYQGVAKRSEVWRRAGTGVLALTMLKVFAIDVWQLDGLLRVGALIALAVAMGGLAWLYRWAGGMSGGAGKTIPDGPSDPERKSPEDKDIGDPQADVMDTINRDDDASFTEASDPEAEIPGVPQDTVPDDKDPR